MRSGGGGQKKKGRSFKTFMYDLIYAITGFPNTINFSNVAMIMKKHLNFRL